MNVEKIANAVLYEGYVLYPYRASAVKNQQRFNFGVLYPPGYGEEASQMITECLVLGNAGIDVKVRFLQMADRNGWQEGIEREVCTPGAFTCDGIEGEVAVSRTKISDGLFRFTVAISNRSPFEGNSREEALLRSMVSVHTILHAQGGEFVSLLDPPEELREAAAGCRNVGTWPVLVGEEGQRDTVLSAPIILYDYPQIAPEIPGDLCDGLEIDEILALRILTLTEAEKQEVRGGDERARKILERTEMLPPEQLQKLHGALRGMRR